MHCQPGGPVQKWAESPETAHLTIAVNISARQQFCDPEFVTTIQRTLSASGAEPHQLRLELTESMFHSDVERTIENQGYLFSRSKPIEAIATAPHLLQDAVPAAGL